MARLTLTYIIVLAVVGLHTTYGMDCTLGLSQNVVDQLINSCPRPLIDSESEKYCCWSQNGDNTIFRCCNLTDFTFNFHRLLLALQECRGRDLVTVSPNAAPPSIPPSLW